MTCLLPRRGLRAILATALGQGAPEPWEVRLTAVGAGAFTPEATVRDFPEIQGLVGYAAQIVRAEEWQIFDAEAFAEAKRWRLLPRAVETIVVASALLVGLHTATLYVIQPFDEPVILLPSMSGGAGVDLEVSLHLMLRPLLLADVTGETE